MRAYSRDASGNVYESLIPKDLLEWYGDNGCCSQHESDEMEWDSDGEMVL